MPKAKKAEGKNKKAQTDTNNTTIKKAGRASQIKLSPSILDLSTVCKSLSLFYLYVSFYQRAISIRFTSTLINFSFFFRDRKSVPWATAAQIAPLMEYHDFYHYLLRTLLQIIHNVKRLTEYNLRKHKGQHMKTYFEIGK